MEYLMLKKLPDIAKWQEKLYERQRTTPSRVNVFMDAYMQAMNDVQSILNVKDTKKEDVVHAIECLVISREHENKMWRQNQKQM